ncbi:MAG: M20/M25/M40 family metallo-hydrolase [Clostridia bacterium]|nr:M20/M25/M40 family metallo-hydrolase [Clostridia bacterium]
MFSKLIAEKQQSAKYMVDEITHICKDMPKRAPGSEGEKVACEYMADVLKNECGCERVTIESFKENPNAFFGWIYITITCVLLSYITYFFVPLASVVLTVFGFIVMFIQFGFYKKLVDFLFPEATGTNVTAIKKPKGETKARILFDGHPDAVWTLPFNNKWGGWAYEGHIIVGVGGALVSLVFFIIATIKVGATVQVATPELYGWLYYAGFALLIFAPFMFGLYFMWDERTIVDGANDNLSGCYMGIAILKAMKENGIELEHVEVGALLCGSEEAGLRGAKAWADAHKDEFQDGIPTWIIGYDTIREQAHLNVNYRDLNGTVKMDEEVCDAFMDAAKELDLQCSRNIVPPFGGATNPAAFQQAGYRAASITGMNHKIQPYYHTMRDTYDNMDENALADCYAISVKVLENFAKKYEND